MSDSDEGSPVIEIALDTAFQHRPVNTQIFQPFLLGRLMEDSAVVENTLEYLVQLQNIGNPATRSLTVRWTWTEDVIPPMPLAAQREYVTEAAAVGMALTLVQQLTPARLLDTARRGDRFDYLLSEDGLPRGVEISGSQTEDRQTLRDRQAQKTRQLLDNPTYRGGYVVIVGFTRREVILSYHTREEETRR